ncbi:MAG: hypothetical protein AAF938_21960 [Myxococcota bacterium]
MIWNGAVVTRVCVILAILGSATLAALGADLRTPFLVFVPLLAIGLWIDWARLSGQRREAALGLALLMCFFGSALVASVQGPLWALGLSLLWCGVAAVGGARYALSSIRVERGEFAGVQGGEAVFIGELRRYSLVFRDPEPELRIGDRCAFSLREVASDADNTPFRRGSVHGELLDVATDAGALRSHRWTVALAAAGAAGAVACFSAVTFLLLEG